MSHEVSLHHTGVTINPNNVLLSKEDAVLEHGIYGNIIAKIIVQGEDGQKEVGLVDYGDFDPEDPPYIMYLRDKDKPVHLGRVQSRFALQGLNYSPDTHMFPYTWLDSGKNEVGRKNHPGYMLGLSDQQKGTKTISGNHFTVDLGEEAIKLIDHSTNGTRVILSGRGPAE